MLTPAPFSSTLRQTRGPHQSWSRSAGSPRTARVLSPVTCATMASTWRRGKRLNVSWIRCARRGHGGRNSKSVTSSAKMRAVGTWSMKEGEQFQRGGIAPVQVFDDQQHRLLRQRQEHRRSASRVFCRCRGGSGPAVDNDRVAATTARPAAVPSRAEPSSLLPQGSLQLAQLRLGDIHCAPFLQRPLQRDR